MAHERIVMAAYGELADDAAHELDRHLATCQGCAQEKDQLQALKLLSEAYPVCDPDPNLVARSRMRLEEALDAIPPKRWFERLLQRLRNNAASLQAAPIAACLLLIIGGGAGSLAGFHIAQVRAVRIAENATQATVQPAAEGQLAALQGPQVPGEVANIASIVHEPNSEFVEVHYNQIVPQKIRGTLDDQRIRQLLMLASANAANPGIRDDSIGLLAAECRAGHQCTNIRDALLVALRYDRSAAVRQKALEGLQPYIAEDFGVRDAVLEALLNDPEPRIRTAAINMLEPVDADTSVRQVLRSVANTDQNPHIRLASRQVLSHVGEIQ
ncbi:HEAT repeat domain-containing protein [Occallatibacter riparius]|uniref:HEAT repeat domain-containing protein n=1 Tax=Occallatibacter riparius TaxID=1002689 RepID=A0A9J7BUP3_9BACT|nr:HEAT repeat domain-containing protein [Occallatibacter riparius]UWZ85474.1 HEAT repeat domain-containing protein [Occallatibacter riparius]